MAEGGIERTLPTRAQRTGIISSGEQGVLKVIELVGNPGLLAGHTDHRLLCFQSEYRVRTDIAESAFCQPQCRLSGSGKAYLYDRDWAHCSRSMAIGERPAWPAAGPVWCRKYPDF